MKELSFLLFFLVILLSHSCRLTSQEEYFGTVPCDSTEVNPDTIQVYYEDLTYIFTGICQSCHSTDYTESPGIKFDGYENTVNTMNTGKVIPAINHLTSKMPKNQAKLGSCEIQRITVWYKNGMPKY